MCASCPSSAGLFAFMGSLRRNNGQTDSGVLIILERGVFVMKKFLALLMAGVLLVSCGGAALAVHDSDDGKHVQEPGDSTPSGEAINNAKNKVANDFSSGVEYADEEETYGAFDTSYTTELGKEAVSKAEGQLSSGETSTSSVSIGRVSFERDVVAFFSAELKGSQKGDALRFSKGGADSKIYSLGLAADSDTVVYLTDNGNTKIDDGKVPENDATVIVGAFYEAGKNYEPVLMATESTKKGGSSSSSGCDAGFGTLALMAVAFLGARKFF